MMTREERLTEAKLMAIEKVIVRAVNAFVEEQDCDSYKYANDVLLAIHNAEIAEELRSHEAGLETDEH